MQEMIEKNLNIKKSCPPPAAPSKKIPLAEMQNDFKAVNLYNPGA